MGHYSSQLTIEGLFKGPGIFPDAGYANVDFPNNVTALAVIEGQDVGVCIVVKVFLVHFRDESIRGKNVGQRFYFAALFLCNGDEP